ncbi:MAG: acyl-CoA thioesterase [Deltaproteobacteria bacterium]|nr:acyl-CoA thioesterase [Deltaproteobacteria bacterium]
MGKNKFKMTLKVRFFDIDMLAHTNNAAYFTFMEEARMDFFESLGYSAKTFNTRCPIILVEASCRYKSASFLHEALEITVTPDELKEKSFALIYEIREKTSSRLVAQGRTVQVTFDYHQKKVIAMPAELKEKLLIHA